MALPKLINFVTINNKKEIERNGIEMLDLTGQIISLKSNIRISQPPILISKELEGKPTLVSKLAYGSEDHADLLMFFNGITNPLSLEIGTQMIIPDLDSMRNNVTEIPEDKEENLSAIAFNKKISQQDKERLKEILSKEQNVPADKVEIRPTNITAVGTDSVTPVNGRIVLGTNITKCDRNLSATQKISEQIRSAVRDKIKNMTSSSQADTGTLSNSSLNNARSSGGSANLLGGENFEELT